MKFCPYKFTGKFHQKIRTLYHVPNFDRTLNLIRRQFLAGRARPIHDSPNNFIVMIKEFPCQVVLKEGCLITAMIPRG